MLTIMNGQWSGIVPIKRVCTSMMSDNSSNNLENHLQSDYGLPIWVSNAKLFVS